MLKDWLHRRLRSYSPEVHWFCPRQSDDDTVDYDEADGAEEDMDVETKQRLVDEARDRQKVALHSALILGMSEDAQEAQVDYIQRLKAQLTRCDKCVRNYHMGRKAFFKDLRE